MTARYSKQLIVALCCCCFSSLISTSSAWLSAAPATSHRGSNAFHPSTGFRQSIMMAAAKRYRESSSDNDPPVRKPYGSKSDNDKDRPAAKKYQMRPTGGGGDLGVTPYKEAPMVARQIPSSSFTVPLSVIATETPLSDDFSRKMAKEDKKKRQPKKSPLIPASLGQDDQPAKIPESAATTDRTAVASAAAAAPPKAAEILKKDSPNAAETIEKDPTTKIPAAAARTDTTAVDSAVAAAPPNATTTTTKNPPGLTETVRKDSTSAIPATTAKIDTKAVDSAVAAASPEPVPAATSPPIPATKLSTTTAQNEEKSTPKSAKKGPLIPTENTRVPIPSKAAKADTAAMDAAVAAAPPKIEPKISQRSTVPAKGKPNASLASAAKADTSAVASAVGATPPKSARVSSGGTVPTTAAPTLGNSVTKKAMKSPLMPTEKARAAIPARAAKANTAAIDSATAAGPPKVEPKISQRSTLPAKAEPTPTLVSAARADTRAISSAVAASPPKTTTGASPAQSAPTQNDKTKPEKKTPLVSTINEKLPISAKASKADTTAIDSAVAAAPPKTEPKISQRSTIPTKRKPTPTLDFAAKADTRAVASAVAATPPKTVAAPFSVAAAASANPNEATTNSKPVKKSPLMPTEKTRANIPVRAANANTAAIDSATSAAPPKVEAKISQRSILPVKEKKATIPPRATKVDTSVIDNAVAAAPPKVEGKISQRTNLPAKGIPAPSLASAAKADTTAITSAVAAAPPKSAAPTPKAVVTPETSAALAKASNVTRGYVSLIAMAQDMVSMRDDATALVHAGSSGTKSPDARKLANKKHHKKETQENMEAMVVMDALSTGLDLQEPEVHINVGEVRIGAEKGKRGEGNSAIVQNAADDDKLPLMPPDTQYLH